MTDKKIKSATSSTNDDLDLGKILGVFIDGKWIIFLFVLVALIFGISYAFLATPIYKSDALIQVEQKSSGGFSAVVSENLGDAFSSESTADAEIQLITSRMILGATVDKFNLTTIITPNYFPVIGAGIARLTDSKQSIKISKFEIIDLDESQNTNFRIKIIDSNKKTYALYDDKNNLILKGKAGKTIIANGIEIQLSDIHSENGFEFYVNKISKISAINWLKSKISAEELGNKTGIIRLNLELRDKKKSELLLNDISNRYFLQNVERDSAEAEQSIKFLKDKLPQLKAALVKSENKLNDYRKKRESVNLTMEAESTLKVMVNLDSQLNELTFKEAEISQKYTKDHPAYKALLDKRQTLLKQKKSLTSKIESLPETQKEILSLKRDVEVNQQIYVQLLNKIQELNVVKAGTVGNVRIIDKAESYPKEVSPVKGIVIIASILVGLIFSIVYLFLKMLLHKGIETPDQLEEIGLSVYANIPKSELQLSLSDKFKKNKNRRSNSLLAEVNPADLSIEAFRGLRTSLHFAMMESANNILMISGPAPGIGKSFVSTNFATVYAQTNKRVLIIDADMRKGYLHSLFSVDNKFGLSDYLSGTTNIEDCIQSSNIENLDIIARGQVPPNPSELLMHKRLSECLDKLKSSYDLIIIDTPPVLAVTDASIVGALAGTTLMVARYGVNTVKEVEVACSRFEQSGIRVKGMILNAIEKKASSSYGGYGYYNYSYKSDS